MAKSIRLKTETQVRVIRAVAQFRQATKALLSDAAMVDLLVNEALDAREAVQKSKESRK